MNNQDKREIYNLEMFKKFINENKEKIYQISEANTKRNERGQPVICRDDPWFDENEWDDH